ncbi:NADH-quinone oxidoreductase subunit L [Salisaeta longa]|uniref:NADH-quinone oxidoreductase subunit L n=1 Tax=Salisaeta longa TaxID=503170 RepID=UPI0003B5ECCD|nr:NADH-quinone oxidoreductase subunit L [Salisaeta longa]
MKTDLIVRLILLLPLLGALVNGLVPLFLPRFRRKEGLIGAIGTAVVAIPFALAVYLFATYGGDPVVANYFTWLQAGDLSVDFAYRVDELSLIMLLVVTGVGSLIHVYSTGYMHGDPGYWRFFAYLNLFIFAMLNLILANNLLVLFLGWEGVGLCSYLLIGFWYTDLKNSAAANKAFIVNRVGDFAFLMAMFLIFQQVGSLSFDVLLDLGQPGGSVSMSSTALLWAVGLLFIGATGKSAQIPLFVWLPDAMAGPTPVSALIHAATMVTSGLYLLARLSPLVLGAPEIMVAIGVIGALTSFMAATIAIAQNDIKKVLAYSTVSQLGYMFMAAGVGAFFVSIFHVVTHAFFKACLFLGSGSVIHAMEHVEHDLEDKGHDMSDFDPQDMRTMGGLKQYMPSTSKTYLLATMAISGIPLFAGFFSKDEILFKAFAYGYDGHPYAWMVWGLGIVTAALTAFYMTRSYILTFEGTPRWPEADTVHAHESASSMTIPLWILGGLSVVGGFIGLPAVIAHGKWNWIHHYLGMEYGGPVAEAAMNAHVPLALEWGLIALSALIAVGTVAFAWRAYKAHGVAYDETLKQRLGGLYRVFRGKYYWDEFYDRTVVGPLIHRGARKVLAPFDARIVDGIVNGLAILSQYISRLLGKLQTGVVQTYALAFVVGVTLVVYLMIFG